MQEVEKDSFMWFTELKSKISQYLVTLLAVIGVLLSVELIIVYYNANFVAGAVPSFCSLNEYVDCDAVAKTQYSVFLGIPLAVYGLIFYLKVAFLSIMHRLNIPILKEFKNTNSYIFSLATVAVIISVILSLVSSIYIHKICILCYITYFINLFILIASKSGINFVTHYHITFKDIKDVLSRPIYRLASLSIMVIVGMVLLYFNTSQVLAPKNATSLIAMGNPVSVSKIHSGNILGSKNPKLIIHEYTDFQCPYCSISNLMMQRLVAEVPDVQVIHHDFPLGGDCNPQMNNPTHKYSCLAALYALAAEKQDKKWALIDLMFENQENLSEQDILNYAKTAKLDVEKLKKDAHDPVLKKQLKEEIAQATHSGVRATPSYFIGMQKYEGLMPYPELKQIVINKLK